MNERIHAAIARVTQPVKSGWKSLSAGVRERVRRARGAVHRAKKESSAAASVAALASMCVEVGREAGIAFRDRVDAIAWTTKVWGILTLFAVLFYLAGPVHFVFRDAVQIQAEALDRGKTLVRLLAAANEEAFSRDQEVLFSTDAVRHEVGVRKALVVDTAGVIVAPSDSFGTKLTEIEGFERESPSGARAEVTVRDTGSGVYLLTYPITVMSETDGGIQAVAKGTAYISFDARSSLNRVGYQFVEAIKYGLLLALAAWGVYLLLSRWTLVPMRAAVERIHSPHAAPKAHTAPMTFAELDPLVALAEVAVVDSAATAGAHRDDLSLVGSALERRASDDVIVLDARGRIALCLGNATARLGARCAPGTHIVEALMGTPYLREMTALALTTEGGETVRTIQSEDECLTLTAEHLEADGAVRYTIVTLLAAPASKKRRSART